MNKNLLWALLLLVISILVLIFNKGSVSVDLPFHLSVSGMKSIVFLVFMSIGVAIGVLLK
jgi:hypothetical protein